MFKYITFQSLQSVYTMSETITQVIKYNQSNGYIYCGDQTEIYDDFCFICLIFKRDEIDGQNLQELASLANVN